MLRTIPTEVSSCATITNLDLSKNNIATIGPQIAQLTALEVLDLGWNPIVEVDSDIAKLAHLKEIRLSSGQRDLQARLQSLCSSVQITIL